MLILNNSNELGDKILDGKENLVKQKEELLKLNEQFKLPDQAELEDQQKAMGYVMEAREFMRRLKLMSPAIMIEDSTAIRNSVCVRIPAIDEDGKPYKKYVSGFFTDFLPEFTYIMPDSWGRPWRAARGWREVLMMLIKSGVITFPQVVKHFGDAMGQRAKFWNQHLQGRKG